MHTSATILTTLQALGTEEHRQSKARLGVPLAAALGVSLPAIRSLGKEVGRDHAVALELWASGYHEARLLAALVADPQQMDAALIEQWVGAVVSWDLCDHLCSNLFCQLSVAIAQIPTWAADEREFVRRAAFALITTTAIHQPQFFHPNAELYLQLIRSYAHDPRNYVKKAISWALREIGKRFRGWQEPALQLARELAASADKAERWVGKDALNELENLVTVAGRQRRVSARTQSGQVAINQED
jgi:3-methyladenine DNA glycosylase AlkD